MLPRRCILCCDTSITRSWHGQCVSSSALKATKPWRAGSLNGSLRSGQISSSIGRTVWSACLPDGSRVRRESHARFCERPVVKFHRPTQPFGRCYSPKTGRAYLGTVPSKKRVTRVCDAISSETGRSTTLLDAEIVVGKLNRMLNGWANYFCLGPVSKAYRVVEQHACKSLRQWLCAKHKVRGLGTGRFPDVHLHHVLGLVRLTGRPRSFPCANS